MKDVFFGGVSGASGEIGEDVTIIKQIKLMTEMKTWAIKA